MKNFVYLASQSPRRRQLLEQIGVQYELLLATPEEDAESLEVVLPNEAPLTYVKRVTQLKLEAAVQRMKQSGLANALAAKSGILLWKSAQKKRPNM